MLRVMLRVVLRVALRVALPHSNPVRAPFEATAFIMIRPDDRRRARVGAASVSIHETVLLVIPLERDLRQRR